LIADLVVIAILAAFVPLGLGLGVLRLLGYRGERTLETFLLGMAVGLAVLPIAAIVFSWFHVLDYVSVYSLSAIGFIVYVLRFFSRRTVVRIISPKGFVRGLLPFVPLALWSWVNWESAFNIHSVDIGWHILWTEDILKTNTLPNYWAIEPFDQAAKFSFGPHVYLAMVFGPEANLLTEVYWVPLVVLSFLEVLLLYSFAVRVTNSRLVGMFTGLFFVSLPFAGGFIQRGNLPDVLGFFLLLGFLYTNTCLRTPTRYHMAALVIVGTIAYHAYASLVLWGFLLLSGCVAIAWRVLRGSHLFKVRLDAKWLLAALIYIGLFLLVASNTTYLNPSGFSQVRTGNWSTYVLTYSDYVTTLGTGLLVLALWGALLVKLSASSYLKNLILWIVSLIGLSVAPLFGINIEPIRFVWRLAEPLSLLVGTGIFAAIFGLLASGGPFETVFRMVTLSSARSWQQRLAPLLSVVLAALIVVSPFVSTGFDTNRFHVSEPYLAGDRYVGNYLRSLGGSGMVVADADHDPSVTWIGVYSPGNRYLYRVSFGSQVAPLPYKDVYKDLNALYSSDDVFTQEEIIAKYNISYIVIPGASSQLSSSPLLRMIASQDNVALYAIVHPPVLGVFNKADGWVLHVSTGDRVALLRYVNMTIFSESEQNISISLYSHITTPAIPNTAFNITFNGLSLSPVVLNYTSGVESHVDYEKFWPDFSYSGMGGPYQLNLSLHAGFNSLEITSWPNAADFEFLASDLLNVGISFPSSLAG